VIHRPESESTGEGRDYVVVGHCCESGDLFSCGVGEPEVTLADDGDLNEVCGIFYVDVLAVINV
jgi:diaminopimelate decarboxylase